ncbi:TonB-dependent receptor [Aliifodinibius salicampi]|uniref:TonB-dependent receptor n=1 Tax=Fodinibius salicampi TaxID=1920655 RepID=A0ABT3PXI1_9BACT|nr:TonB-dependent receptor [Fodinibius salicampi]MCW9712565.1 TonB-dependent receptor [Fodinibius salicampi]
MIEHKKRLFLILFLGILLPYAVFAQSKGTLEGAVVDAETSEPIPGANIFIPELSKGAATDSEGNFTIPSIAPGNYDVEISFVGYQQIRQSVAISGGETVELTIELHPSEMMLGGITVTALRPDLNVDANVSQAEIRKANPRDSGELLRSVNGVDAVRRGPVGLDPVVRGLRETEVGTYLDGTRIFPAGPARMDSPLSHLDPTMIENIEIVKGPYALSWGAGNMSAIRVETKSLNNLNTAFGGNLTSGYDSNFNTLEEAASLYGQSGKVGYMVSGAWRTGDDYASGNGTNIPGDYLSREIRGKVSYEVTSNSRITASLGYQNQEDIDYPGRLLDATYFNTYNGSLDWEWNPENNIIRNLQAKAYINNVSHGMDNDNKPTAQPDPDRMPPFALDVEVEADNYVSGGKLAAMIETGDQWDWEVGTDIYSSYRDATRRLSRRDNGQKLFFDLMWPEATITDLGIFNRLSYSFSEKLSATATGRMDFVRADADTISQFFEQNIATNLDSREANFSASGTLNYQFFDFWSVGLGLGSVVRTADATERYSDRIPASKAQMSAEFVGNPDLEPERSTQADLWLNGRYENINLSLNGFVRHMDNYITLEATNFPKRLPLSPETVYQYINGSARFAGFDISACYRIVEPLTINSSLSYLWGQDTELDEPALGVSPLSGTVGLRYEFSKQPLFLESTAKFVSEQERVATARGETSTEGYTVFDLQGGWNITNSISLQAGVKNLLDRQYINHLNAKNPYSGMTIAEPGRVLFGDISVRF